MPKHKLSHNLLVRIRDLSRYILDIKKCINDIDEKDLKQHISVLAIDAKNLLNITDGKLKTYVNRTGKTKSEPSRRRK
jgi:hypothetical protein